MWRVIVFVRLLLEGNTNTAFGKAKAFIIFKFKSKFSLKLTFKPQTIKYVDLSTRDYSPETPIVSVVVPHHNYGRYLEQALDSLLNSTLQPIEIIVIESGSSTEDLEIVQNLAAKNTDSRLRFIFTERNRLGVNRNIGVRLARSNLICSFDPDDLADKWYLEVASFHIAARDLEVSGASTTTFGDENKSWILPEIVKFKMLAQQNCVPSHAIFTKKIWAKVGGFKDSQEEEVFIHEDWLFWSEAARLGARIRNVPGALINLRIHGKNMSRNPVLLPDHLQARLIRKYLRGRTQMKKKFPTKTDCEIHLSPSGLDKYAKIVASTSTSSEEEVILVFVPWLDQSGAGKVFSTIANNLKHKQLRFLVVSTEKLPPHARSLEVDSVEHFRMQEILPPGLQKDFVTYLIKTRNVKTIWQMGSNWFYENCSSLELQDITVVDSIYNTKSLHILNHLKFNKHFKLAVFESEAARLDYINMGGASKTMLAPNGISLVTSKDFSKNKRDIDVLFLGRLAPEKDPFAFVTIAQRLLANKPKLRVCIAGDGPLAENIQKKLSRSNNCIEMLGHVDEVSGLLSQTKIIAITSTPVEGRPNTIFEAIKEGVAVVSFDVGSINTVINHGFTGLLSKHGNEREMADNIQLLLENPSLRSKLANNALHLVRKEHSWQQAIEAYENALTYTDEASN